MRTIEIRRHSLRDRPEPHLSDAGRALAVAVGRTRGPFRVVVASPLPRAVETAEAMVAGTVAVERNDLWRELDGAEALWPRPFEGYANALAASPTVRRLADRLGTEVAELYSRLGDGERALVVTHGGFPELLAARLAPVGTAGTLGGPCRCLEGIELAMSAPDRCVGCGVLRLPPDATRL